ncbi:MAG: 6,7-dimethyl-8-ribityllumazine synthase [Flavobacteriales bacterium]|nr:6,7-dimethyl-8-ribityllumazine synthase [Flavobacteriales bacterium]
MASQNYTISENDITNLPSSKGMKFLIIQSKWNNHITDNLFQGTFDTLIENGVNSDDISSLHVPGSFELIYAANAAANKDVNAIICIGSVIKGETDHFNFICNSVSNGIKDLNIKLDIPVIFGVLTDNTEEQAIARSGGKLGNKGIEFAISAIQMAHLRNSLK